MSSTLQDSQFAYFLQFQRPLLIFLGLLYLDRPATVLDLSWLFNVSEPTLRRDLHILRQFGAVKPAGRGRYQAIKNPPRSTDFGWFFDQFFAKSLINIKDSDSNQEELRLLINNTNRSNLRAETGLSQNPNPPVPEPGLEPESPLPDPDPDVIQALQEAGIYGIKLAELSRQPHITADYVSGWEAYLKLHQPKSYTTGLLVHVLGNAQPLPQETENGHPQGCTCKECDPHYYARCYFCKQYPCVCGLNPVEF